MNQPNKLFSDLVKEVDFEDVPSKRSRENYKKEKELEALRKAGKVPALIDEDGKEINPHIPEYIASAPWYIGASVPTLRHQKAANTAKNQSSLNDWFIRGKSKQLAAKYRPGSCENCGAMGHTRKFCFERPRKITAKVSGVVIAPDDPILPNLKFDYDGKRDRWNGFQPQMYQSVIENFKRLEEAKKVIKESRLKDELATGNAETEKKVDSDSEEEDKYAEKLDMPGTKVDSKQRITVRNLRIREDTAKYLRNLDPDSAHYDPKTRSMRGNPYANSANNPADLPYAGENFARHSGDTLKVSHLQLFSWQARDKGADIHVLADPTKTEKTYQAYEVEKKKFKKSIEKSILDSMVVANICSSHPEN
uniref:Pre-mRNA-splicing factor SLU7 n=1 Tax=Tetranychus urticae TaxID=32264 RepID=T1KY48_TETUR